MLMSPDLFLDGILCIINDNSDKNKTLVEKLIKLFEETSKSNTTIDNDLTKFYIRILKSIMAAGVTKDSPDDLRLVLLKFQSDPVLSKRSEIYQLLHDMFLSTERMTDTRQASIATHINNMLLWHELSNSTKSQFAALSRSASMVNPLDQAAELNKVRRLSETVGEAFQRNTGGALMRPESIEKIDMSDPTSMDAGLQKYKERTVQGVIRMGLQGLNRMFGDRGGLVRGESLVVYALKHNYKSGLLMSVVTWAAMYNTPNSAGPKGNLKKLILMISLENEAYQNYVWMFRHHYETMHNMSSKHLTDEQVKTWCLDMFNRQGFTIIIERFLPQKFTYQTFVNVIEFYENSGYEIILAAVDYLNLMNKSIEGLRSESNHLAVRDIFSVFCNYTKSKGITFVTAHPLNRKAAELRASGITNVVRRFDENHLADSVDVAREVDVEVFINIEKNLDNVYYLTCNRGKHRYVDNTPDSHKYFAYRFREFGIRDDVMSAPEFVSDIYADVVEPDAVRAEPSQPNDSGMDVDNLVF